MPRVTIKKKEYKVSDLSKYLVMKMYENQLHQKDLAKMIGISPPAFCGRMKKGLFSYEELITLIAELNATDDEILKLMKM